MMIKMLDLRRYKEITDESVIEPMISFMEDWGDCDYTMDDIENCKTLIYNYLEDLEAMLDPDDEMIMAAVEKLVLALNELNESVDYSLIETEAREAIADVIQTSAIECGLQEYEADITEEWREW